MGHRGLGSEICRLESHQDFGGGSYYKEDRRLIYVGRTGANTIKVRYIEYFEVAGIVITDETNDLDIFVESPDSISVVNIGGTEDIPALSMHITLSGSDLYYKVISDGICLGVREKSNKKD